MKKNTLLSFLLFITCSISLHAQFSFGIKAGFTNSKADYGDIEIPDDAEIDVNGFNVSTLFYYEISPNLRIGIEPGMTRRGAACFPQFIVERSRWGIPFSTEETKVYLRYLEAPIVVSGVLPLLNDKLEISANIGYSPTYISSAFRTDRPLTVDSTPIETRILLNDASTLNRWDHGLYGGISLGYKFESSQIFIQSEYYYGLKDIEKNFTSNGRAIDLSIGYLYHLKKS